MRTAFAIAALAGSAFAAPHYGHAQKEVQVVKSVHLIVETVVQTVYVTEGYETHRPKHTHSSKPVYSAPAVTTTIVYQPSPAPTSETYEAPAPSSEAPAPTTEAPAPTTEAPAPTTEAPAPTTTAAPAPTASGYMAVVDTWRSKLGKKALACDSKLEANALDTVVSSNGVMIHKLNPGTMGQVLAPGNADDFEHVFVGGWLCEIPTLPGLDGVCATQSNGWDYQGQTGHADILTSDNYSKIGCKLYAGIWACDLA